VASCSRKSFSGVIEWVSLGQPSIPSLLFRRAANVANVPEHCFL
jgi:hypothetical protein